MAQDESAGPVERGPRAVDVSAILRAGRWHTRLWVGVTVLLWVCAAGYLLGWLLWYLVFVHPAVNEFLTNPEWGPHAMQPYARGVIAALTALLWWPVLFLVAALSTVMCALVSRRATLRQIQASLVEISAALKNLPQRV